MNGGQAEFDRVLKAYNDTEDNQERKYTMFTLGATNIPALKQRALDWAVKSGDVKLQDFFYPIGSVASTLVGAEQAWKYYQDVSLLSTVQPILSHSWSLTYSPSSVLISLIELRLH
jgi:hypothetical protein